MRLVLKIGRLIQTTGWCAHPTPPRPDLFIWTRGINQGNVRVGVSGNWVCPNKGQFKRVNNVHVLRLAHIRKKKVEMDANVDYFIFSHVEGNFMILRWLVHRHMCLNWPIHSRRHLRRHAGAINMYGRCWVISRPSSHTRSWLIVMIVIVRR